MSAVGEQERLVPERAVWINRRGARQFCLTRFCLAGLLGVTTLALSGCYERVVRADGPGARGVTVYEPNLSNDPLPLIDDVSAPRPLPKTTRTRRQGLPKGFSNGS